MRSDSDMHSPDRSSSDDSNQKVKKIRLTKEQKNDPYFMATQHVEYLKLKDACQTLLE